MYGPRTHWLNQTIERMWEKTELWRNLDLAEYTKFKELDHTHAETLLLAAKQGLFDRWIDLGNWAMRTAHNNITLRPHNR